MWAMIAPFSELCLGPLTGLLGAVEHTLHRVRPAALPRRPGLHGERLPVARGSSQVRYPCDGEIPYEKLRRKRCTDLGLDHQVVKNFAFSCAWLTGEMQGTAGLWRFKPPMRPPTGG